MTRRSSSDPSRPSPSSEISRRSILQSAVALGAVGTGMGAEAAQQAAIAVPQSIQKSNPMTTYIGTPTSRVDGRAKVTGAAKYAAEFNAPAVCVEIQPLGIDRYVQVSGNFLVLAKDSRNALALDADVQDAEPASIFDADGFRRNPFDVKRAYVASHATRQLLPQTVLGRPAPAPAVLWS